MAIHEACIEKSKQKNYDSSILNINYTTPFKSEDPRLGIVDVRNIHGSLGRTETIFGIDGKDVAEDDPALPFTKTYRLLSLVPYESETVKLCDGDTSYIRNLGIRFLEQIILTFNLFLTLSIFTVEAQSLYLCIRTIQINQMDQLMNKQFVKNCIHAYRIY